MSLINMTPDGFADAKFVKIDPEFYDFTHELLADTRTVAFGRTTFELFQERWPLVLEQEGVAAWQMKMATVLNDKQKVVYSSTLKTTRWNNSTIVQKVDATEINSYKKDAQDGLLTLGSLNLVASLAAMNLIDDYYFCMQPVIAGGGDVRLFDRLKWAESRQLEYVDSRELNSGVHIIYYRNVN